MDAWVEIPPKFLAYAALLLGLGGVCVRWLLLPRALRLTPEELAAAAGGDALATSAGAAVDRVVLASAATLVAAQLLRAVAHTVAAFGMADAWNWENLSLIALESQWGLAWQQQTMVAAAFAGAAALGRAQAVGRAAAAAAAMGMCVAMPGLGHAAGEPVRVAVHAAHILAGGCWLGALAVVAVSGAPLRPLRPRLLQAFAPVAAGSVALLVATGGLAAWTYLGPITNLWETLYGRILGVKGLLVVDALTLGALNWNRIHRQRQAPLPGIVAAEVAVSVAIVGLTAWLTETGHP